jgi:class 3 adenylate cyclase
MDTISECFAYCLEQGGEHVEKAHLVCMLDAWDLLSATASLVARGSEHADGVKEVCAEAVKACEESCEAFEGDETMAACADACREAYAHLAA